MGGPYDGPNWRDDPLESAPPVRRGSAGLTEMLVYLRSLPLDNPFREAFEPLSALDPDAQYPDTDGLAAARAAVGDGPVSFMHGFPVALTPATAAPLPSRALRPLSRTGGLFCLPV
jgi:hypothetical protein